MASTITTVQSEATSGTNRWLSLTILLLGIFLAPLDFFILNVALPSIQQEFGASPAELQLLVSAYSISYATFLITGGRLGDFYGRRRLFLYGLFGFIASSAICGFASSAMILIVGRTLLGISAACMVPQGLATIHVLFSPEEKARVLGLYGATYGLASIVGQMLGGILISANLFELGWRSVFLVNLPAGLLIFGAGALFLKNTRSSSPAKFDFSGVFLLSMTLLAIIVPLVKGRESGWASWTIVLLICAPILAMMFWRHQVQLSNTGAPLVDPAAFRSPVLRLGLIVALLLYAIAVVFLLLSVYLQTALGKSALYAGLVFSPLGVGFFIAPLLSTYLVRWIGKNPLLAGLSLEIVGLLILAGAITMAAPGISPPEILLFGVLFVVGFGQGLALPGLLRTIIDHAAAPWVGLMAGIVNSALQISAALSIAVIGGIFYTVLGNRSDPGSIADAFVIALLAVAACLLVAAACVVVIRKLNASGNYPN